MSGTSRQDPARDRGLSERDQHAYEDAWYRALKAKAEQRAHDHGEDKAETPAPASAPAEDRPVD